MNKYWNKKIAIQIAKKENIILDNIKWKIIFYIRNQIYKYNIKPNYNNIINYINKNLSISLNSNDIYNFFPKGIYKQAFKIAGISNNLCF